MLSTSTGQFALPGGREILLGVRRGGIERSGAYFATAGSSTYFDPTSEGVKLYDLADVHIADSSNPETAIALLEELLRAARFPFKQRGRIDAAIKEARSGDPFIDYLFADELPLKEAGNHLGFGGVLVWENDDIAGPSSAFIWQTGRVRELTSEEVESVLAYHAAELYGPKGAAELVRDRAHSCDARP